MASASAFTRSLELFKPVFLPLATASVGYALYKGRDDIVDYVLRFVTGPGRTSRIIALLLVVINWKSLPFAWTVRVWNTMVMHIFFKEPHKHTPDKLFHPVISQTHVTLMEVDYNLHKSNSTYFADLDVSRSHFASHLFSRGIKQLANNEKTRLVMDPRDLGNPARGPFGVVLGAVMCSFKKEIKPYQPYEMWTRLLCWDRKWMYIVTHFVAKGAVKPRSWDASNFGLTRKTDGKPEEWEKKIFASAISKYVWKIGRLTVHPAIIIEASGLLPERPDGWVSPATSGMVTPSEPIMGNDSAEARHEAEVTGWDWKRTEAERLRGLEYAQHFSALDGLSTTFDGGEDGALGKFSLG